MNTYEYTYHYLYDYVDDEPAPATRWNDETVYPTDGNPFEVPNKTFYPTTLYF